MGSLQQHTPAAAFDEIPGQLPDGNVSNDTDLAVVKSTALTKLNEFSADGFKTGVIWRDLLAFTDTFRTFSSAQTVDRTLKKLSHERRRSVFKAADHQPRLIRVGSSAWVDVDFEFTVQDDQLVGRCSGCVSVTQCPDGTWQVWMLRTWLECWDGYGHPDYPQETAGGSGASPNTQDNNEIFNVIIVGGGQGGISVAGRLKCLGISHILFEAHEHIGDQWANRYASLRWHTARDYSGLPFGYTFDESVDEMVPTKTIAAAHRQWSDKFGVNALTGTTVESARYDENLQLWTVRTRRSGATATWTARNLVVCIGSGHATPVSPEWASAEKITASGFSGTVVHGSEYRNADAFAGKRGVVIGTANTAHDVAEDMANVGMETTMVQRNSTFVFPVEWLHRAELKDYNRHKAIKLADREVFTYPNKIMREMTNFGVHSAISANPDRFDALENAGFKVDRYGDIYTNLYIRFGGHYVDIGASERISKGEIKVKTQAVQRLTKDGLLFDDGSEVHADLIVLATGFDHDFRKDAAAILGADVADRMDDFWGVDGEGEIRGHARLAGCAY